MATASTPDFNRLARIYRWMEYLSFGPLLWRCRIHFLHRLMESRNALVLGDGDGRFTARLLQTNSAIQVHTIDGSPRMIECLQRAAKQNRGRLVAETADIRNWNPNVSEAPYDLIVTHFFLDCLTTSEVADLARRLRSAAAPDTLWLISEFAIPPTFFGRAVAAPLVAGLYATFRLLTELRVASLPDYARALTDARWSLAEERRHLRGLLVSQLWRVHSE